MDTEVLGLNDTRGNVGVMQFMMKLALYQLLA
jgi:hypothetical protein